MDKHWITLEVRACIYLFSFIQFVVLMVAAVVIAKCFMDFGTKINDLEHKIERFEKC